MSALAPDPGPMIRTARLTRRFGALTAVDQLDLEISAGEIFGLVGPDGAGKSTTMRMLAGILDPSAGEAWVAGCHTVRQADALKDHIAYMSQGFGLYADLTVQENIEFYAELYGVARQGRRERMDELLSFSNMQPFKRRLAGHLSGGMKQKLQLVCALIHTPQVLLLDEPTNGVDPVSRRDFWRILYQLLKQGVTIFVSTAYLDEAERCNRLALLHQGRLLALGTPSEVKQLMRGTILELRSSAARQLSRLLKERLTGCTVGLFGDRVHVVTLQPSVVEEQARSIALAERIELTGVRPISATLEDVFISVIGGNGPEGGGE